MEHRNSDSSQSNSPRHRLHKFTPIRPCVIGPIQFCEVLEASRLNIEIRRNLVNEQKGCVQCSKITFRDLVLGTHLASFLRSRRKKLEIHNYRELVTTPLEIGLSSNSPVPLTKSDLIRRGHGIKLDLDVSSIQGNG